MGGSLKGMSSGVLAFTVFLTSNGTGFGFIFYKFALTRVYPNIYGSALNVVFCTAGTFMPYITCTQKTPSQACG